MPIVNLRHAQVEQLARATLERFRAVAAEHLQMHFPEQCEALGDALGDALDHGLARARAHGFERTTELLRYLDLCFVFGRDFDTSGSCPWAARILGEQGDAAERMDRLHAAGIRNEGAAPGAFSPEAAGGAE